MTKADFCLYLISRFICLDDESKYTFLSSLVLIAEECEEDKLGDWAETMVELLFPEMVGDVEAGPLPPYKESS